MGWCVMKLKLLVLGFLIFGISMAQAARRGDQGVGVMMGNPSGFSYKFWLDEKIGIDGAAGIDQGEFDLHATFLIHNFDSARQWAKTSSFFRGLTEDGDLPWYFGFGPRILFEDKSEFGIRFPVGFSFLPHNTPWEGFAEFAPVWRITPDVGVDADFAVGVRYYFPAIRPRSQ